MQGQESIPYFCTAPLPCSLGWILEGNAAPLAPDTVCPDRDTRAVDPRRARSRLWVETQLSMFWPPKNSCWLQRDSTTRGKKCPGAQQGRTRLDVTERGKEKGIFKVSG